MINAEHPLASWFLLLAVVFFTIIYGVPLCMAPLRWARWFQWELPTGNNDLTVYFGRCTGALAVTIIIMAVQGISDPKGHRMVFDFIALACGLLTGLHIWGAIQRMQPWTETAEIVMYAVVSGAAFWLRTTLV